MRNSNVLFRSLVLTMVLAGTLTAAAQMTTYPVLQPVSGMIPPHPPRMPEAVIPAFPGAWGAGMFTVGGRGGKVWVVTNLDDHGPGSLREALEAEGPRIVVFRVAGTIFLESNIDIVHPYVTIAGQSAPGDGICLADGTLSINTYEVIVRHIRARRGYQEEIMKYDDGIGGNVDHHVIIDHCSTSWALDENISLYRHMRPSLDGSTQIKDPSRYITIQWTISSEALAPVSHGATWGGAPSTFHHNLFACNKGRNASIGMSGPFDFRNNVIFNWGDRTVDGGDETSLVNLINNYYKPGPATQSDVVSLVARLEERHMYSPGSAWAEGDWYDKSANPVSRPGKWYIAGNLMEGSDEVTRDNWKGVKGNEALARVNTPFEGWPVAPHHTALETYEAVLAGAGATLPRRDAVDRRIVDCVRTGKTTTPTGIISSVDEAGGYPELTYKQSEVQKDSDNDGMPDAWETKYGLNPQDASDAARDLDKDGYTNIEEYLNGTDPTEYVNYRNLGNNIDQISMQ